MNVVQRIVTGLQACHASEFPGTNDNHSVTGCLLAPMFFSFDKHVVCSLDRDKWVTEQHPAPRPSN